jgi:hypothetical protein
LGFDCDDLGKCDNCLGAHNNLSVYEAFHEASTYQVV